MTTAEPRTWESLRPFSGTIRGEDQVLIIAMAGGAKSTLTASLLLDTPSLVALDSKGRLTLPDARTVQLPPFPDHATGRLPDADALAEFDGILRDELSWRDQLDRRRRFLFRNPLPDRPRARNRVVVRPYYLDVDDPIMHDRLFRAVYLYRPDTILWIDEITGTGASSQLTPRHLRAISARGRTRGIGLWTMTQRPFGLVPGILRDNATVLIVGPIDPDSARDVHREGIAIATTIPTRSGRFLLYVTGEREPYRLLVPIPDQLKRWEAP